MPITSWPLTPPPSNDVVVGWVRPKLVDGDFMDCLLLTLEHDRRHGQRLAGKTRVRCTANISDGRNQLVHWFLNETSADWLWMVDTDMVWRPDCLDRLLAHADPDAAPIVGSLCFARESNSGQIWPTLYELEPIPKGDDWRFFRYHSWPEDTMFQVDGTGAAFLLVHRRVFKAIRDHGYSQAYPWFQETENSGGRVSEDLTFCFRARDRGFPIHVHTGVQVGHVKDIVIGADTYRAQQRVGMKSVGRD